MKVSELEGAQLDYWVAMICFEGRTHYAHDHRQPPRIHNGRCEVYDNPCGGPGPCWGWYPFLASTLGAEAPSQDVGSTYVRYGTIKWTGGPGPELIAALRAFVASKFGEEVAG